MVADQKNKSKFADLHIHTKLSDGTFSPEMVLRQARGKGLSCIAITDHDTVSGIEPAIKEGNKIQLEVIPGIELTAEENDYEIHILGYLIDWQQGWFQKKLEQICQVRRERALTILHRLKEHGITIDADELMQEASGASVGRLHIARLMQKMVSFLRSRRPFINISARENPVMSKNSNLLLRRRLG